MSVDECRWVSMSVDECYWERVAITTKTQRLKKTDEQTHQRIRIPWYNTQYPHKGIIYPLCSEENKGIPPVQWQIADRLHNIEGAMGVTRRRSYTYTLSHFFIKTTGITQGNTNRPLWDALESLWALHKGVPIRKDPQRHTRALWRSTHTLHTKRSN